MSQSLLLIEAMKELEHVFQDEYIEKDKGWEAVIDYCGWKGKTTIDKVRKRWNNMVNSWKTDNYTQQENHVEEDQDNEQPNDALKKKKKHRAGSDWFPAMTEFQKKNPQVNPRIVHDSCEDAPRENLHLTQRKQSELLVLSSSEDEQAHPSVLKQKGKYHLGKNKVGKKVANERETRPMRKSNLKLLEGGLAVFKEYCQEDINFKKGILEQLKKHNEIMHMVAIKNGIDFVFGDRAEDVLKENGLLIKDNQNENKDQSEDETFTDDFHKKAREEFSNMETDAGDLSGNQNDQTLFDPDYGLTYEDLHGSDPMINLPPKSNFENVTKVYGKK